MIRGLPGRLALQRSLRARLLPLVVLVVFVVALSAPVALHWLGLRRLHEQGDAVGARAAALIQREAQGHPTLWRYQAGKLVAHLRAADPSEHARYVVLTDAAGRPLRPLAPARLARLRGADLVWSAVPIRQGDERLGTVWVGLSSAPLRARFFAMLGIFAGIGLGLGLLVYGLVLRSARQAEARLGELLGEVQASRDALEALNETLEARVAARSADLQAAYGELKQAEERLRRLAGRALAFHEAERRAVGRELHDGVGQGLTAIRINLQLLAAGALPGTPAEALAARTLALTDETIGEVRRAVHALGPALLGEIGLGAALARHCEDVAERSGITVTCDVSRAPLGSDERHHEPSDAGTGNGDDAGKGEVRGLGSAAETALYRIVQEALHNAVRHGAPTRVQVRLADEADQVAVEIADDGRGFDPAAVSDREDARGLAGIRERVTLLGGRVELDSAPGEGTRLRASIPRRSALPAPAPTKEQP